MPSNYWIKLYHEILDDPKMGRLPDHLWRRCIEMFLSAGDCNNEGHLPSTEDMAWRLRCAPEELAVDLEALAEFGIVEERDGHWFVRNFAKRQAAMPEAERLRRYRERKRKQVYYGGGNEERTDGETKAYVDTDTDTDTDQIQIAPSGAETPPPTTPPKKTRKPRAPKSPPVEYFRELTRRYPNNAQIAEIDDTVMDQKLWQECVTEWQVRGYKTTNIRGMLDWYKNGGPPQRTNSRSSSTNDSHAAIDRAVERIKAREANDT